MRNPINTLDPNIIMFVLFSEDDYQCIIVLQEEQELSDITEAQITIQNPSLPIDIIQPTEATEEVIEKLPEQLLKANTWTKRTKKLLLIHYINYMRLHKGKKINQKQLWDEVAAKIPNKTHNQCKKMFIRLKNAYMNSDDDKQKNNPLHILMEKVLKIKPKINISPIKDAKIQKTYKDVEMHPLKVEHALTYYLNHIDDFGDPKFEKKYLWTELANHITEPVNKVYNKINYLKQAFNVETEEIDGQKTAWSGVLNEIIVKEASINVLMDTIKPCFDENESNWSEELIESLLNWYLTNLDKFKNPKFNRSYLWMEASSILNKSPVVCSKKMSEIRTQYRNMVKNNEINDWRFFDLCQKIYGTGRKNSESEN